MKEVFDMPTFAGSLFLCKSCGGALVLIETHINNMIAVMQCSDCKLHHHSDVVADSNNPDILQVDLDSLKRA